MDGALLAGLLVVAAAVVLLAVLIGKALTAIRALERPDSAAALLPMQAQLEALRDQVRASLDGNRLELDRRLEETHRVVGEVRRSLGAVDQQVRTVGAAARDLRGLQELLRAPKARGGMGEYLLSELLAQVLPQASFTLQHEFPGGERVDAALQIGEKLVPVDAKFPLENFERMRVAEARQDTATRREARRTFRADVKRHVDAIAKRYIRPGEGTYEFAMMYIPAEAVYQELLHQEGDDALDLFHYALSRQVVPVSPQSFYAYLQVIVLGLRGLTVESRTREILEHLGLVRTRLERFTESFEVASRHVGNAQRQLDEAGRRLARLEEAFGALSGLPGERSETEAPAPPAHSAELEH